MSIGLLSQPKRTITASILQFSIYSSHYSVYISLQGTTVHATKLHAAPFKLSEALQDELKEEKMTREVKQREWIEEGWGRDKDTGSK